MKWALSEGGEPETGFRWGLRATVGTLVFAPVSWEPLSVLSLGWGEGNGYLTWV